MLAPSQFPRNRITVAAWMAEMDRQRGARIRQLREERSLGREELAPKLGVSVKTLYNWEKGNELNPGNLRSLAKFFNVTVDYIRAGELPTPDLLHAHNGQPDRLDQLEDRMEYLIALVQELITLYATEAAPAAAETAATNSKPAGSSRKRAATPKKARAV